MGWSIATRILAEKGVPLRVAYFNSSFNTRIESIMGKKTRIGHVIEKKG